MMKLRYPPVITQKPGFGIDLPRVEPVVQLHSYLHQLVDELNVALDTMEADTKRTQAIVKTAAGGTEDPQKAQSTFNSIKALIIKSADIVNAYYEVIDKRLSGEYVALSDFGKYTQKTEQQISGNAEYIEQLFENFQEILTDIENVEHALVEVSAHIRSGVLYYDDSGIPVYGLEIGQKSEVDGVEVFNKYARFTADRLAFFDSNGVEVAYISDKKLFITHVEVTGSYTISGFVDKVLGDGSVVTRWVKGG